MGPSIRGRGVGSVSFSSRGRRVILEFDARRALVCFGALPAVVILFELCVVQIFVAWCLRRGVGRDAGGDFLFLHLVTCPCVFFVVRLFPSVFVPSSCFSGLGGLVFHHLMSNFLERGHAMHARWWSAPHASLASSVVPDGPCGGGTLLCDLTRVLGTELHLLTLEWLMTFIWRHSSYVHGPPRKGVAGLCRLFDGVCFEDVSGVNCDVNFINSRPRRHHVHTM